MDKYSTEEIHRKHFESFDEYARACRAVPLRLCPFCGAGRRTPIERGVAIATPDESAGQPGIGFRVWCNSCGVFGPGATGLALVVEAWNRRTAEERNGKI